MSTLEFYEKSTKLTKKKLAISLLCTFSLMEFARCDDQTGDSRRRGSAVNIDQKIKPDRADNEHQLTQMSQKDPQYNANSNNEVISCSFKVARKNLSNPFGPGMALPETYSDQVVRGIDIDIQEDANGDVEEALKMAFESACEKAIPPYNTGKSIYRKTADTGLMLVSITWSEVYFGECRRGPSYVPFEKRREIFIRENRRENLIPEKCFDAGSKYTPTKEEESEVRDAIKLMDVRRIQKKKEEKEKDKKNDEEIAASHSATYAPFIRIKQEALEKSTARIKEDSDRRKRDDDAFRARMAAIEKKYEAIEKENAAISDRKFYRDMYEIEEGLSAIGERWKRSAEADARYDALLARRRAEKELEWTSDIAQRLNRLDKEGKDIARQRLYYTGPEFMEIVEPGGLGAPGPGFGGYKKEQLRQYQYNPLTEKFEWGVAK